MNEDYHTFSLFILACNCFLDGTVQRLNICHKVIYYPLPLPLSILEGKNNLHYNVNCMQPHMKRVLDHPRDQYGVLFALNHFMRRLFIL